MIKRLKALDTYSVRHPVLRSGRPIEDCAMPGDDDATSLHLGCYHNNRLTGVVSLMNNEATFQDQPHAYQLRGMAVLPTAQGQGLGSQLLVAAQDALRQAGNTRVWAQARIAAVPFYEKHGWQVVSDAFEIEGIGTHYQITKQL